MAKVNKYYNDKEITSDFRVDQYDNVYDENGIFYCKWFVLSDKEKDIVCQNELSAY